MTQSDNLSAGTASLAPGLAQTFKTNFAFTITNTGAIQGSYTVQINTDPPQPSTIDAKSTTEITTGKAQVTVTNTGTTVLDLVWS